MGCWSGGHITFMVFCDLAAIALLSFNIYILHQIKGGDLLVNKMNFKKSVKTCGMQKTHDFNKISHTSSLTFILKQNKLKSTEKAFVSGVLFVQVIILVFSTYFPKNEWWPPLICFLALVTIGTWHYIRFPYVVTSDNYLIIVTYYVQSWGFLRTFLISLTTNTNFQTYCSYALYLTPIIGYIVYLLVVKRGENIVYSESDEYDLIQTQTGRGSKRVSKLLDTIIDCIQKYNFYGVRVKTLRIDCSKGDIIVANAVFSIEGHHCFQNCLLLLAKLYYEHNVYFAKISFYNLDFYIYELKPVQTKFVTMLTTTLSSKVFWYLKHLELHNFLFLTKDFLDLINVLVINSNIKILDIHHNQLIDNPEILKFDPSKKQKSKNKFGFTTGNDLLDKMRERYDKQGEMFNIDIRTKQLIWNTIRNYGELIKVTASLDKSVTIDQEIMQWDKEEKLLI